MPKRVLSLTYRPLTPIFGMHSRLFGDRALRRVLCMF